MRLRINKFYFYISFPSIALISFMIISNYLTDYLLCLIAIIIHESGHLVFMVLFKYYPIGIEIKAFNIKIIENIRYKAELYRELIIILSGPIFNLLFSLVFLNINSKLSLINIYIGIFNLLPAATLDGGQFLYLVLQTRLRADLSAKFIDVITIIIALPLFFVGILVLFFSRYNFSLLFIALYLILSLFLKEEKYF